MSGGAPALLVRIQGIIPVKSFMLKNSGFETRFICDRPEKTHCSSNFPFGAIYPADLEIPFGKFLWHPWF
jgi:hypothetical protein